MKTSAHAPVRVSAFLMFVASAMLVGCGTFELGFERRDQGSEPTSPAEATVVAHAPTESSTPGLASREPASTATPTSAQLAEPSAVPAGASGPLPTVTLKPTETATDTPTPTPRPPQPRILSFAADPSPANPLGAVALSWEVHGANSVTLQWSDPEQNSVVRSDLPLAGSLSVAAQDVRFEGGDHLRFWILAQDAGGQVAVDAKGERVEARLDVPLKTEMRIDAFSASPDPVQRGGTVTLTWNAPGATSVGITRLSPQGDIFLDSEAVNLPAAGSFDVVVPEHYPVSVKYYLGARDAGGVLRKAYVTVGIVCPYETYLAPSCPVTQDFVWAAYEPFEGGHMVWRSDSLEIYVLYDDGSYETFEDTWQEGDPVVLPGMPPSGLYGPVRGFGHLWTTQPHVQQKLGWATAEEKGYTMQVETIHGGSGRYPGRASYLTVLDGRVVSLAPFHPSWQFVD